MRYSYATQNEIPESLRAEYTEVEGQFVLNVTDLPEGFEVGDTRGLRSALKKERDTNKTLAATIAELEGGSATEHKKLAGKVDQLAADNQKLLQALNEQRLTNLTSDAIAEARGNAALLRPYLEKHVKLDEAGKPQVIDDAGQPLLNKAGEPVSVRDFVLALREVPAYMGAFAGTGNSGGGTPPSGNGGTSTVTPRRSQMDVRAKSAYIREHGTEKFLELPA